MSGPDRMGLSSIEARTRLQLDGLNDTAVPTVGGLLATIAEVVREPMLLMLVSAGNLYLFIEEAIDAGLLLVSVVVVVSITVVQERRTHRALDALRELASPSCAVIRDGTQTQVPSATLVQGDVLRLNEGDRVPADAILKETTNLRVDESLLTGEAVPVANFGFVADTCSDQGIVASEKTSRGRVRSPVPIDANREVKRGTLVTSAMQSPK